MSSARRKCAKCGRNRAEKFFVSARGRVCVGCRKRRTQYASREVRLKEQYGITLAEYGEMLAEQQGKCAICFGTRPGNLDIDHDHRVEKALIAEGVNPILARRRSIRGLLCKRCNRRLLPAALDTPMILQDAIEYLHRWPADEVLGQGQAWLS